MKQKKNNQSGFTLVELSIVIAISGVVMLAAAHMVKLYTVNLQYEKTLHHLKQTHKALDIFRDLNGRYPCPADPTLAPTSANYGLEECRVQADIVTNENDCTAPTNPLSLGISCAVGVHDGDENGSDDVVMIGIIPFRTLYAGDAVLGLAGVRNTQDGGITVYNESMKFDGWARYISYAVTEHMTDAGHNAIANPVNPSTGGIRVIDENNQTVVIDSENSAHYIIYSAGENGRGAYTSAGQRMGDCFVSIIAGVPAPPNTPAPSGQDDINGITEIEIENCDDNDGVFRKAIRSLADGDDYNDDLLLFRSKGETVIWKRSLTSPPGQSYIYNTNIGNVGIGTVAPTRELHIVGDLSTENSTIAIKYCDDGDDDECLDPNALAGTGSFCVDPTHVAYAIHDNKIVCRKVDWVMPAKDCSTITIAGVPTPRFIKSFSNVGNIVCCTIDGNNCVTE